MENIDKNSVRLFHKELTDILTPFLQGKGLKLSRNSCRFNSIHMKYSLDVELANPNPTLVNDNKFAFCDYKYHDRVKLNGQEFIIEDVTSRGSYIVTKPGETKRYRLTRNCHIELVARATV